MFFAVPSTIPCARKVIFLSRQSCRFRETPQWRHCMFSTDQNMCPIHLVEILTYSSNVAVTLKSGLWVIQWHWKWCQSIDHIILLLACHRKYLLLLSSYWILKNIMWWGKIRCYRVHHTNIWKLVPYGDWRSTSNIAPTYLQSTRVWHLP